VNDLSAVIFADHLFGNVFGNDHCTERVYIKQQAPILFIAVCDANAYRAAGSGAIDQDINLAEFIDGCLHRRFNFS